MVSINRAFRVIQAPKPYLSVLPSLILATLRAPHLPPETLIARSPSTRLRHLNSRESDIIADISSHCVFRTEFPLGRLLSKVRELKVDSAADLDLLSK